MEDKLKLDFCSGMSIQEEITAQEQAFYYFIKNFVLDKESWNMLNIISCHDQVYVLSGIIRDFLTGDYAGARDFDCVLLKGHYKDVELLHFLRNSEHCVNSFGGMKIKRPKESIDIWRMEDTWGIKREKLDDSPESLIRTVFFNFSAIVYDFNNRKFIFDDHFCRFLQTLTMDVVYPKNPNVPLCLVNVLYYHQRYGYHVSVRLAEWIKDHFQKGSDLESVQIRHFGKLLFSNDYIEDFFHQIINKVLCIK